MDFFEQQDRAQRNTRRLVVLLALAVISLIAITTLLIAAIIFYANQKSHHNLHNVNLWHGITHTMTWPIFASISLGVCGIIFLGSLFKLFQLSSGGRAVAEAMGGRLINLHNADADEKKILNVVEEMAIASGTPVPPVYILEEDAINAFAAGHTPQDAVIGITRGCIHLLSRDELQGVIAHEFSHIFHGDMSLNMRLVALLNGILLLGLLGEFLVRSSNSTVSVRSNRDRSPGAILGLGLGLMVIGYTGTFFGNLIKSAVSRQREFLADASAVKFTRNPDGISGALKKIGGYFSGSRLENNHAAEFSHMYFSEGVQAAFGGFMATHPPLEERIKRIEPRWDGEFPSLEKIHIEEGRHFQSEERSSYDGKPIEFSTPDSKLAFTAAIDHALQSIGQPNQTHIAYAQQSLTEITSDMHQAAHNPWEAEALMLGLLLDKNETAQQQQWQLLNAIFSPAQIKSLNLWAKRASLLAPHLRLPLIELSLSALKNLSAPQYQHFKYAMNSLIRADQQINLTEWSLFRIITNHLEPKHTSNRTTTLNQLEKETALLLSAIANAGAATEQDADTAFNNAIGLLGFNTHTRLADTAYSLIDLELAVTRLHALKPLQKPKLLKAMSQCIMADQRITVAEAELFRAIADSLDCPIPPLVASAP